MQAHITVLRRSIIGEVEKATESLKRHGAKKVVYCMIVKSAPKEYALVRGRTGQRNGTTKFDLVCKQSGVLGLQILGVALLEICLSPL